MKINFEPIGKAMQMFDTDLIDIGRRLPILNPDGTEGETSPEIPIYTKVPCHISFISADNPNTDTADTKPIIVGLQINCSLDTDLQNGDYIVAYKMANDSTTILETYKGIIGEPTVTQSRKSAEMKMETDI